MAPPRAKQDSESVPGSSKERPNKKTRHHPYKSRLSNQEDALPGVQKLKSALRQTKRLLAKENLAADVRVETERRLKALEADIASAEQSRQERHYATKYHKVKFFERRKVLRKINQTKRSIASSEGSERGELESALADFRVDLNYILHFPKTKKYVSLFPPEVRKSGSSTAPVAASSDENEERSEIREMIRQQMEHGELSNEPENDLGKLGKDKQRSTSRRRGANTAPSTKEKQTDDVAGDDFFANDDDEDSQQSDIS